MSEIPEVKTYTLEEIKTMVPKDGELEVTKDYVAIRRWALDRAGTFLTRAFHKADDKYVEFDVVKDTKTSAKYLAASITSKKIIEEVLLKLGVRDIVDLTERVNKQGKVTVGIQRGSCVYLYVRGKRGASTAIQLTE
jgi:hypothetical protein